MIKELYVIIFVIILLVAGCGTSYPPEVDESLDAAGENRAELEHVLKHFAGDEDTLKFNAACFLIGNIGDHGYATYKLVDSLDTKYELNVLEYPDFDSLIAYLNTIEQEQGELDFERDTLVYDRDVIRADFLIDQIDYAFKAWREKPWANNLSYEQFKEYILPYRGSNEPLEPWRSFFWEKYKDMETRMADPSDAVEAAGIINDDIKLWFTFDERYYLHPTDQGLTEMLTDGMGRCEDMTNLAIYAMRANGIAVTSDYTPYWGNRDNNHAWNAILIPGRGVVPFMGGEAKPGDYNLVYKAGKIYRKTFSKQKDNLVFQANKQEKVPGWLKGKNYIDVSDEYALNQNITVVLDKEIRDSINIAYLCVFNSGKWRAVDWAMIEAGDRVSSASFENIAAGVAFIPALYTNEEITPCGMPFVTDDEATIIFAPSTSEKILLRLGATQPANYQKPEEQVAKSRLIEGKEYELFYWQDGWQSLGKKKAGGKLLVFEEVPSGALYWLVEDGSDGEYERIFRSDGGDIVYWL